MLRHRIRHLSHPDFSVDCPVRFGLGTSECDGDAFAQVAHLDSENQLLRFEFIVENKDPRGPKVNDARFRLHHLSPLLPTMLNNAMRNHAPIVRKMQHLSEFRC
jgi:hypothetical protein